MIRASAEVLVRTRVKVRLRAGKVRIMIGD